MTTQNIDTIKLSKNVFEYPGLSLFLALVSLFAALGFALVGTIILATYVNTSVMTLGTLITSVGIMLSIYMVDTLIKMHQALGK